MDNPRLELRPSWDQYFADLCVDIAKRSLDPNTQVGCVIINKRNKIIATGYNSYPPGCDDRNLPHTRPDKYNVMVHAEEAAICSAAELGTSISGCTIYVPFEPCVRCARMLISAGIKKVKVFGNYGGAGTVHDFGLSFELFKQAGVEWEFILGAKDEYSDNISSSGEVKATRN